VHGAGSRCRVDYSLEDDGPWAIVQIMCIEEDSSIEHYTCAMPRYYAVPLILLNKRLAYFEGQCAPDGTPLPFVDGSQVLKLRGIKEYTYLWRVRYCFLQAVFDLDHERQFNWTRRGSATGFTGTCIVRTSGTGTTHPSATRTGKTKLTIMLTLSNPCEQVDPLALPAVSPWCSNATQRR